MVEQARFLLYDELLSRRDEAERDGDMRLCVVLAAEVARRGGPAV